MTDRPTPFPVDSTDREAVVGVLTCRSKSTGKPRFTAAQRLAVFEAFGAVVLCQGVACENVMRIKGCDIDHHLAWIDGGKHELSNWRPLCEDCHKPKSAGEHIANCKAKRNAAETQLHRAVMAGEAERQASRLRSRGFDKTKSRKFNGKVVAR